MKDIVRKKLILASSDNVAMKKSNNADNFKAVKRKGPIDSFVNKKSKIDIENQDDSVDDINESKEIICKKKAANIFDSSDSESGNSDYEVDNNENTMGNAEILDYFNNGSLDDLTIIAGCSDVKAKKIISSRPYKNITELKANKVINDNIIEGCNEILIIKKNLSKLLNKCETISANLTKRIKPLISDNDLSMDNVMEQPKSLTEGLTLKSYQLVGINWLRIVHDENLNGILADEMGLGKTIQTIGFLAHLYENDISGPHLIIVPTSTLNNWQRELNKWCPQLSVVVYHGSQDERRNIRNEIASMKNLNVLLTTYNTSISNKDDRLFIKKMNFHYGIFDEAHMLKNMLSIRYQYLSNFKIKRKLLLTGTPLQNNLVELISLLSFVMPSMFLTSNDGLKRIFQMSQKKTQKQSLFNDEKMRQTKEMLTPFCLRRLKSQVLSQMPQKTVEVVMLPLCEEQSFLYNRYLELSRKKTALDKFIISPVCAIMELRKISNHTLLTKNHYTEETLRKMSRDMLLDEDHLTANQQFIFEDFSVMHDFEIHRQCENYEHAIGKYRLSDDLLLNSNKIQYLDENIPKFIANGDRILIFSQFIMTLDIIGDFLKYRNYSFLRLDGSTAVDDRQEYIDDFNENSDINIFLLTTRAGGLGINLTAANVVILHDIDYNPYNDRQAEDRSHRIGQLREVRVIKLISKDTVEEFILHIATEKLKLDQITITEELEEDETASTVADAKGVDYDALFKQAIAPKSGK